MTQPCGEVVEDHFWLVSGSSAMVLRKIEEGIGDGRGEEIKTDRQTETDRNQH